jgi:HEAT repeat protein
MRTLALTTLVLALAGSPLAAQVKPKPTPRPLKIEEMNDLLRAAQQEALKAQKLHELDYDHLLKQQIEASKLFDQFDYAALQDHWLDLYNGQLDALGHKLDAEAIAQAAQHAALAGKLYGELQGKLYSDVYGQAWGGLPGQTSVADEREWQTSLDRLWRDGPRAATDQQDPADSVWKAARDRLNRNEWDAAARLFARIHQEPRFSRSSYRAESFYWEAFALGRMGTSESLRRAQEALGLLMRQFPEPERPRDTNGLMTTIQGQLAQLGSVTAATNVRAIADEARVAQQVSQAVGQRALTTTPRGWSDIGLYVDGIPMRQRNPQCENDQSEIRLIALNALVRMDSTAAMPVLREVMARRDECAAPLRERALMMVSRINSPDAENMLYEAARNDPDSGVRQAALVWLSSRNADRAIGIAEEALRNASDAQSRQWALQALAKTRNERAWRVIRDYASRADLPVDARRAAIGALGSTADSTNAAYLRELYSRVNERELREAILMSSAFRRGGGDAGWLMAIASNENVDVRLREYALTMLGRRSEMPVDRLATLYDRTAEKRIKQTVLGMLGDRARNEPAAIEKLVAVARNDTDAELRKRALYALADSNDPRARELMIELVTRK